MKLSISTHTNSTHIGLDKIHLPKMTRDYLQKAVEDILKQLEESQKAGQKVKATSSIPYSLFPDIRQAIAKYQKKHVSDFLILYHDHIPIGIIKEARPYSFPCCPECGIMVRQKAEEPKKLSLIKRMVKLFFREAYPQEEIKYYECATHGRLKEVKWATI